MAESDKIERKKKQTRLEKLSQALKQNLSRRKKAAQKNINDQDSKNN